MQNTTTTERIWEELGAKLGKFILGRVSDYGVAEDLLQETFIRIHKKLDELDKMQSITSWAFQVARNLIIDHYRARARDADAIANDLMQGTEEEKEQEEENCNELVLGWLPMMIAQLPDPYRQAVELFELEGIPQQQIADKLEISLSGAKSRVQRGREKLKVLLFDCCTFERDRRGNLIGYQQNGGCEGCDEQCECH